MASPYRFQGVPDIIYGTAFKFDTSAPLVEAALKAGFRALDTAGSKSAYREALVGEGIAAAIADGAVKREELYVSNLPVLHNPETHFPPAPTSQKPKPAFTKEVKKQRRNLADQNEQNRSRRNSRRSKSERTRPSTPTTRRRPSPNKSPNPSRRPSLISA